MCSTKVFVNRGGSLWLWAGDPIGSLVKYQSYHTPSGMGRCSETHLTARHGVLLQPLVNVSKVDR